MTAYLLLAPGTPMLFQGQEFASTRPFHYFADHKPEVTKQIYEGRVKFLSQFRSLGRPEMKTCFSDPGNPSTFQACKLDFRQREANAKAYRLHKDLMQLRREDPVFRMQKRGGVDGAVLGPEAFVLRYFGEGGDDRLLVVNLGLDLHFDPAPEPLLAPPAGRRWRTLWSSEDPRYGGCGTFPLDSQLNWRMPGQAAVALISASESEVSDEVELPANE
jgi:maltooligosyltrehalose trehalohydrolase